ncbi:MAG: ATP-binding cassette domain-containing protein, partial [Desulfuromonadales bacterium]|nr:ATP-binding cassette domain-containing protein [Desulfuromonadales bacterium]
MSEPALLEIRNLQKTFTTAGGEITILQQINVKIVAGERVAVVGTSGAGKTTLMHILGGLDHPTRGEILFEGDSIFAL